ncbi:MAG: Ig-like domain-containing protein [Chitinophagales bacterium]
MKQRFTAAKITFFNVLALGLMLLLANSASAQCPIPFPKGDDTTTLRNVPIDFNVGRNDVIFNGSSIQLVPALVNIVQAPAHGTATFINDSVLRYVPNPGFVGHDYITYEVCNACGNCAQGLVDIYVAPYCPAPNAADDVFQVYNNVPQTLNVVANDVNIAGGALTTTVLQAPVHGTATVVNGSVLFNGNAGYTGPDTFTYAICNTCPGNLCDTATVYLNQTTCQPVNAQNDVLTVEQVQTSAVNVLLNDANASGFGTAVVTLLNTPKYGGTATVSGGVVTYKAGGTGFGLDSIYYAVCTDCGCDTALLEVTVTQAPCRKPQAVADIYYAGYSSTCTNTYNVLRNDVLPINGGNVTVTISQQPTNGSASVVNNQIVYAANGISVAGTTDQIRYSVCNQCFCDTGVLSINITNSPCNGLNPITNKDTAYVCRNLNVPINVTANDYDPEGTVVTLSDSLGIGIIGPPAHGNVVRTDSAHYLYTPDANYNGQDFFTYLACDQGTPRLCNLARVDVFVQTCNQPPVTQDTVRVTFPEDSSVTQCITYTDQNGYLVQITNIYPASIDTVRPVSTSFGTNPCVTIVPPPNYNGQEVVKVVICNQYPTCDTTTVIITVTPRNDPPTAVDTVINYQWENCGLVNILRLGNDIDAGDALTVTALDTTTSNNGHVHLLNDSVYCYQPDPAFTGVDTVHYTICDKAGACVSRTIYVIVPINARDDNATTNQEQQIGIDVRANDTRSATDVLSLCSQPLHGTATVENGQITYVPADDYPYDPYADNLIGIGVDSFCYTLCKTEGNVTLCDNAMVRISVLPKPAFRIPEGFSPDGDGKNDKFVIPSAEEYPKSQLLVFNRYGEEVWRNDGEGYQNDWQGTWKRNNEPLPDGSYWYIFKYNADGLKDKVGYIVIHR